MWRQSGRTFFFAALIVALAACSWASSNTGGGAPGTVRGVITSSSALVVNGITFDAAKANVIVDGAPGQPLSELRKGRIATVKGSFDSTNGVASTVIISGACQGMVASKSGPLLDVGGQEVKVDGETEFDDDNQGLGSIAVGERIEVHGFPDDSGAIRATRIEKRSGQNEDFEVKGFVSELQASANPPSFTLRVTPTAAAAFNVTLAPGVALPAGIQNGSLVEVKSAAAASATNDIVATEVKLEDEKLGEAEEQAELEGLITSGNAASFMIGAQAVVTSASTEFIHGTAGDVVPGARVEVEGSLDAQGTLHADKVRFEADVRIQGLPQNLNATDAFTGTFSLMGITVHTDALTEFKEFDGNAVDLQHLGSGLVAIRGTLANNGTDIAASRLELTDDQRLELQGPVSAKDLASHRLTILGVAIDTSSAEFSGEGAASESAFFAAVHVGSVVQARGKDAGSFSGGVLKAKEIELDGD